MADRIAFLYPGQGSQQPGMGRALAERYAVAREVFAQADDVLGFPLSRLCFEGSAEELTLTENTQPALLAVSWATTRVLRSHYGLHPSWAAGHSLGEFSALVAAGALDFADALRLVRERATAMQAAVPVGEGAMAAVFGIDPEQVRLLCAEVADGEIVAPANFNGAGQVVIAGRRGAVERASERARECGAKRVVPLRVSAPFHCALMEPAARRLEAALGSVEIRPPRIPVIANVDGRVYATAEAIRSGLVRQVVSPVLWEQCVQTLAGLGCRRALEVGPGKVLTGLVRRICPEIACQPAEEPAALPWMNAPADGPA